MPERITPHVFALAVERGYKSDRALAKAMGVSPAMLSRVRAGKRGISSAFIAGARRAFPDVSLDDMFTVDSREPELVA